MSYSGSILSRALLSSQKSPLLSWALFKDGPSSVENLGDIKTLEKDDLWVVVPSSYYQSMEAELKKWFPSSTTSIVRSIIDLDSRDLNDLSCICSSTLYDLVSKLMNPVKRTRKLIFSYFILYLLDTEDLSISYKDLQILQKVGTSEVKLTGVQLTCCLLDTSTTKYQLLSNTEKFKETITVKSDVSDVSVLMAMVNVDIPLAKTVFESFLKLKSEMYLID